MNSVAQPSLAAGSPGIRARGSEDSAPHGEQGCSPHPQAGKPALRCGAFTLIEMLVVIAIIGIVAAISVPAIKNFQKSDAEAAATRQLLDDIARARQFAISQRATVYMVFVPGNFWSAQSYVVGSPAYTPEQKVAVTNLLARQLIGYNFVSLREVGDQPGQYYPRYLAEWRTLPEGMFIPDFKFNPPASGYSRIFDPPAPPAVIGSNATYDVRGFESNSVPFPTAEAKVYFNLPGLAFNHLGQLVSNDGRDEEIIPLARGTAVPALDVNKRPVVPFQPTTLIENPPGNSSNAFTLIVVDRLTGRAHVERQKPQ